MKHCTVTNKHCLDTRTVLLLAEVRCLKGWLLRCYFWWDQELRWLYHDGFVCHPLSHLRCLTRLLPPALRHDSENTPLQLRLNDIAEVIAELGSIAGGLLFAALLVHYFVERGKNNPPRYLNPSCSRSHQYLSLFMQDVE